MIYLALLADAALLLVLLRMIWVGADRACPREFFFLLSLLCCALLSVLAPSFPAWGYAAVWLTALPMLVKATKHFPASRGLGTALIAALTLSAAALLCGPSSLARWGNSSAASWALLGSLFALAAGIVLVIPAFKHLHISAISRLRFGIGIHLLLVNGAAFIGVPFFVTVFAATLVWLATAAAIAPTPDALVNEERLAVSRFNFSTLQLLTFNGRAKREGSHA